MANGHPDVVGIGSAQWSRYLVVPRLPEPGEQMRAIMACESADGCVPNALVALARWGLRPRMVLPAGVDDYSRAICRDLADAGIELRSTPRTGVDHRHATILIDNRSGQRSVIAAPTRLAPLLPADIVADHFAGSRVLLIDSSADECALEAAALATDAGLMVVVIVERHYQRTDDLMRLGDYVVASVPFVRAWTGQERDTRAADALSLALSKPVLLMNDGCSYFVHGDVAAQSPDQDDPVVDCSGASDVSLAAFVYGLLSAWESRRIVRLASWAGRQACREIGNRKGIPSLAALHDFLREDRGG